MVGCKEEGFTRDMRWRGVWREGEHGTCNHNNDVEVEDSKVEGDREKWREIGIEEFEF